MNKENKNALFIQHFYFDLDELVNVVLPKVNQNKINNERVWIFFPLLHELFLNWKIILIVLLSIHWPLHDFGFFLLIFRQGAPRSGKELKYNSGLVEYRVHKINSAADENDTNSSLVKISKINTNKDLALTNEETTQLQKKTF